jgi:hypothetical protein
MFLACIDGCASFVELHNAGVSPVLALIAYTDAPAVTNITPSFTTGVAREVPASNLGEVQAPPSRATVRVLIWLSVE